MYVSILQTYTLRGSEALGTKLWSRIWIPGGADDADQPDIRFPFFDWSISVYLGNPKEGDPLQVLNLY